MPATFGNISSEERACAFPPGATSLTGIMQGLGLGSQNAILGTAGYIPKWSATNPFLTATSLLYDSGTGVGIDTTSPQQKLQIELGNLRFGTVDAPTSAPTTAVGAAGVLSGTYYYSVTFVTANGETEPYTNAGGAAVTPVNQKVNLTNIPVSPSSAVTARRIYRSLGTASDYRHRMFLVATISDNVTTTYTDNIADGSLGAATLWRNTTGGLRYNNGILTSFANTSSTAFGMSAGSGYRSTAVGYEAFASNVSGVMNTAFGAGALKSAQNTWFCNAFGEGALNQIIGSGATHGVGNNAFGTSAMFYFITGNYNSAFGHDALEFLVTGYDNTGIGKRAAWQMTTGSNNTVVGSDAMFSMVAGSAGGHTSVGYQAQYSNLSGNENTAIGRSASFSNTSGSNNCVVGSTAYYHGTTASGIVAIGAQAGRFQADGVTALVPGSNNVYIGYIAEGFDNNDTNNVVIGAAARANGANSVVLGNDSVTTTLLKGSVGVGFTGVGNVLEAKLHIVKDTTNAAQENDYAIKIVDGTADVGLLLGVDATNNAALLQAVDPGTSISTRIIALQSQGGNVCVGGNTADSKFRVIQDTTNFTLETNWGIRLDDGGSDVGLYMAVSSTTDYAVIQSLDVGTGWTGRPLILQRNGGRVGVGNLSLASEVEAMLHLAFDTTTITTESDWAVKIKDTTADVALMLTVHSGGNYSAIQSMDPATDWGTRPLVLQPNGGGVVVGGVTRDASAKLQIDSTSAFFLPPRMTKAQRDAVGTPANGSLLYQSDGTAGIKAYIGGAWYTLDATADP